MAGPPYQGTIPLLGEGSAMVRCVFSPPLTLLTLTRQPMMELDLSPKLNVLRTRWEHSHPHHPRSSSSSIDDRGKSDTLSIAGHSRDPSTLLSLRQPPLTNLQSIVLCRPWHRDLAGAAEQRRFENHRAVSTKYNPRLGCLLARDLSAIHREL
jgi:hypothetical protein